MPDETDMPLPVIPVNLPDDTQATAPAPEMLASAIVEAVVPPEALAPSSAPVAEEKAPEEAPAPDVSTMTNPAPGPAPLVDAPATGVPLVGVEVPADGIMREFTLDASPALQLANLQHELAAAHDAAANAQAAHDRVKAERDSLQQRLEESDAKVQALTEERDLLKAAQPA